MSQSISVPATRHDFQTDDARLRAIHEKTMAGETLTREDALALYKTTDILALGWMANSVRERMHGNGTAFGPAVELTAHASDCAWCGAMSLREAAEATVKNLPEKGAVQIVLGGHPEIAEEAMAAVMEEIGRKRPGVTARAVAIGSQLSSDEKRVEFLLRVRGIQERFRCIDAYAPRVMPRIGVEGVFSSTGMQEMKHIAVARLVLHNVAHISASWELLAMKVAQIALRFGADDVESTTLRGNPLAEFGPKKTFREELVRFIEAAGRKAVERGEGYGAEEPPATLVRAQI